MYPHLLGDRYEFLHRIGVGGMAVDIVLQFPDGTQEYGGSWSTATGGDGWLLASPNLYPID